MHEAYVRDVVYPSHFHRELMPTWLVQVLAALGRQAPVLSQPFTWLELGCGSGLSAVVAAATHPTGEFVGVDFNAAAIAQAQALAQAAGVRNVRFLALSFEQALALDAQQLPACDFIVTHGVYSWVSAQQRQCIQQLMAQRLKPGGVAYVGYMSQPGGATFAAAQRLMRLATAHRSGGSTQQAAEAVNLLHRLAQSGAGYFAAQPGAAREVERLRQTAPDYVAHELLNAHWEALHVSDVMSEMRTADCDWVGSATLLDNMDAVSLPAGTQPLLAELVRSGASVAALETFKDVARNQSQRRDLFQRISPTGHSLSAEAHRNALLAQRVALLPAAPVTAQWMQGGELRFDTPIGPVGLPLAVAAPLLQAVEGGSRSYAELAQLPAYAQQPGFVSQLLQMFCWAGWMHFVRPAAQAASEAAARDATARLNQVLATQPPPVGGPIWVSSLLGSAIPALGEAQNAAVMPYGSPAVREQQAQRLAALY